MSAPTRPARGPATVVRAGAPPWWPLAALTLLAAALRLSTLDLQSFWYDEAFTPVHVLHASLAATLRGVAHTENSPPLWYLLEWLDSRVLGTGAVALRLPSALAGIATVPVAWAIGRELAGRPAAVLSGAFVAVGPLFVWYSQEARVYALFVLTAALCVLSFVRAERDPTPRRIALFAGTGALALLTHYFAVFLLLPMVLWLLAGKRTRRASPPALGVLTLVGLALLPLVSTQGGHGTQWIGRWPLSERLQAIPQYFLTGASGAPLGHGLELLLALPLLAGAALGLWRMRESPAIAASAHAGAPQLAAGRARRATAITATIAAGGVLLPVVLAVFGADYLAPRNLVAAMIPVTVLLAVLMALPATGRAGAVLAAVAAAGLLAISLDVDLSARLQRGNWRGVAAALATGPHDRVITSVELGAAPLEYYLPGLRNMAPASTVSVSEIDETGYAPLRASAGRAPAAGFHLLARLNVDGLIVYRFVSPVPRAVSESSLRRHVITHAHPEVLIPRGSQTVAVSAHAHAERPRTASNSKSF